MSQTIGRQCTRACRGDATGPCAMTVFTAPDKVRTLQNSYANRGTPQPYWEFRILLHTRVDEGAKAGTSPRYHF
jgi:hypothetical protein